MSLFDTNFKTSTDELYTIGKTTFRNNITLELVDVMKDINGLPCTVVFNEILFGTTKREHTASIMISKKNNQFYFKYSGATFYLKDFK